MTADLKEFNDEIDSYIKRVPKVDEEMATTYEEKIKELKLKKQQAEKNLHKQLYTSEQFGTASEKVFNTLKNPISMWKSDEYNDKKTVLFMYFEDQLRYNYEKGFGTASLAYPVKLISELGQAKKPSVEMSGSEPESKKYLLRTSTSVANYFRRLADSLCRFQLAGVTKYRSLIRVKA